METKLTKSMSISDLIKAMEPEIKKALPEVITPERFTRMALSALNTSPKLKECTQMSFLAALMNAAQLGLEPNTPLGQAYLIHNNNKGKQECQFQIGYKGLIDLSYRNPQMQIIQSKMVLTEDIYNKVYADMEAGKKEEFHVSEEISDLMRNVKGKSVDIYELEELLSRAAGIGLIHGFKLGMRDPVELKVDMYVMTNRRKTEGAAGILHIGEIRKFAERRGADLYILPSSIQEIILIPFDKKNNAEMLKEMVTEINESQVDEAEQLGSSIYAYSRESGKIYLVL